MSPTERRFHLACHNLKARVKQAISEFERDIAQHEFCEVSRRAVHEQEVGD